MLRWKSCFYLIHTKINAINISGGRCAWFNHIEM
jgi:hypothetical protein